MQGKKLLFKNHGRNGKTAVALSYNNKNNIREDTLLALHIHSSKSLVFSLHSNPRKKIFYYFSFYYYSSCFVENTMQGT